MTRETPTTDDPTRQTHRDEVLDRRAEALARTDVLGRSRELAFDVALIKVGDETFGLPVSALRECVALAQVVRMPSLPAYFRGICQIRGEFMSVVDLGRYLGVQTETEAASLIVLETPQGPVGFAAEQLLGFRGVYRDELAEEEERRGSFASFVLATTRDLITILDPERIARDERLIVRGA